MARKKNRYCLCLLFSLFVFFSLFGSCFAETSSEGIEASFGYLDLQVVADKTFEKSLMINLIDKDGKNHMIIGEAINHWKANVKLPLGDYTVDFVSINGDIKSEYTAKYAERIRIEANKGSKFQVDIKKANLKPVENVLKEEEKGGRSLLKNNVTNIVFIFGLGIALLMIRRRREKRENEQNGRTIRDSSKKKESIDGKER